MSTKTLDLWTLVRKRPQIDPSDLADAVRAEAVCLRDDYRSRLLVRDSLDALRGFWGDIRYRRWLSEIPENEVLQGVAKEGFDEVGYPSLRGRLMEKTRPEEVTQFFTELSRSCRQEQRIDVAGSIALILPGYLVRHTEGVDIVGEVPAEIRENHPLLDALRNSYGLQVGHVQTHYFPAGWRDRASSFGVFGRLQVFLVDVYDVFLSKLFSARRKDIDDLRMLAPQLDPKIIVRRLLDTAGLLMTEPQLSQHASDNWRLLFGEELPS